MDILLLVIGIVVGFIVGYLINGRKVAAQKAQLDATKEREILLNQMLSERINEQSRSYEERLSEQAHSYEERFSQQERSFNERLVEQQKQWEQRLLQQKEEAETLHKRMNTEFENLSNRIFQSKTEDFTKLNAEHINNLLRPFGDNLKDFKEKVEQVYSTEAKERFSLGERIKELVELNNRLSEDCLLYTSDAADE